MRRLFFYGLSSAVLDSLLTWPAFGMDVDSSWRVMGSAGRFAAVSRAVAVSDEAPGAAGGGIGGVGAAGAGAAVVVAVTADPEPAAGGVPGRSQAEISRAAHSVVAARVARDMTFSAWSKSRIGRSWREPGSRTIGAAPIPL